MILVQIIEMSILVCKTFVLFNKYSCLYIYVVTELLACGEKKVLSAAGFNWDLGHLLYSFIFIYSKAIFCGWMSAFPGATLYSSFLYMWPAGGYHIQGDLKKKKSAHYSFFCFVLANNFYAALQVEWAKVLGRLVFVTCSVEETWMFMLRNVMLWFCKAGKQIQSVCPSTDTAESALLNFKPSILVVPLLAERLSPCIMTITSHVIAVLGLHGKVWVLGAAGVASVKLPCVR